MCHLKILGDTKNVPYWSPTISRYHSTFSRPIGVYEHVSKECVCLRRARPCYRFLGLFNDALARECILRLMVIQRSLSAQFHRYQQPFSYTAKQCGVLNLTFFSTVVHGLAKMFPEMRPSPKSDRDKARQPAFRSHHFIHLHCFIH